MKKIAVAIGVLVLFVGLTAQATQLAFPGAEGYGCYATGGRGGDVYHVTNLTDSVTSPQPGSLRYGLINATGPRTIVFDVSGYIELSARLEWSTDNITIAGQTAPGDGITLRHWDLRPYLADDNIIRYIRVRVGHYSDQETPPPEMPIHGGLDALSVEGCKKFIIDHVSVSWGVDEIASITGDSNDVTVQWSILAEPLNIHNHAYISLLRPAISGRYTHHHNLYCDCIQRLSRMGNYGDGSSSRYDWVNNVAYNWGNTTGGYGCTYNQDSTGYWQYDLREGTSTGGTDGEFISVNFLKNYFIPYTSDYAYFFWGGITTPYGQADDSKIWAENNYWNDTEPTQWAKLTGTYAQMSSRFSITSPLTIDTAPVAYSRVLEYAGNWFSRDTVDDRIISEVITRTGAGSGSGGPGILSTQDDTGVGGFPTLNSVSRPAGFDTDGDGMPTAWEEARWWLDPNDPNDRNEDNDGDGYKNLEEYLNYLVVWQDGSPAGDTDQDNDVDINDLAMFMDDWQVVDPTFPPAGDLYGDDNFVDFSDFAVFAAGWTGP
jgi:hypothetical protein